MNFYLVEADGTTIPLSSAGKEYHFYGSVKTGLYFFDGTKLVKISPAVADKLTKKKLEQENPETEDERNERKARIKKIKSDISSGGMLDEIETDKLFYGSDEASKDTFDNRKPSSSRKQLVLDSIADFVATQVKQEMSWGYGKDSPMSLSPDILKKVRRRKRKETDIEINLYFDRSGSWRGTYEREFAKDIIATLKTFEEDESINASGVHVHTNVYYFAVHVWPDEDTAKAECNNGGEPIIQHMKATHPTNIIIMTDSDMSHPDDGRYWPGGKPSVMKSTYIAPGAVWAIFIGSVANTLIKGYGSSSEWHLAGSELTQVFSMKRGEE